VALKPDVILATAGSIVGALQQVSRTVPIVFVTTIDPNNIRTEELIVMFAINNEVSRTKKVWEHCCAIRGAISRVYVRNKRRAFSIIESSDINTIILSFWQAVAFYIKLCFLVRRH
jgi:hypothetical protein